MRNDTSVCALYEEYTGRLQKDDFAVKMSSDFNNICANVNPQSQNSRDGNECCNKSDDMSSTQVFLCGEDKTGCANHTMQVPQCSDRLLNESASTSKKEGTIDFVDTESKFTGARPKLTESRTLKSNSTTRNKQKSVRWSEEIKSTSSIDEITYQHYRNCLLKLKIPNTNLEYAAVEAVLFMYDNVIVVSKTLIDMAMKFLWAKLGCCPKAVELYSVINDFKFEERSFVLAFLEICQSEKGRSIVEPLFDDGYQLVPLNENMDCLSQHSEAQTDQISPQASGSKQLLDEGYCSLSDDVHTVNSENQKYPLQTDEPLRAFDFQFLAPVSDVQTNYSHHHLSSEAVHTVSNINSSEPLTEVVRSEQTKNMFPQEELQHVKIQVLQKEQEYLKIPMICVLCKEKPIEVTLLPCGHFVLCSSCSDSCTFCPVCKKKALAEVKTFLC
uniref:RING-type domain-containing protein n=2 Tax=Arion vulgaris TaxID=1028688 RepID=A0A0B6Y7P9_9EUPU